MPTAVGCVRELLLKAMIAGNQQHTFVDCCGVQCYSLLNYYSRDIASQCQRVQGCWPPAEVNDSTVAVSASCITLQFVSVSLATGHVDQAPM